MKQELDQARAARMEVADRRARARASVVRALRELERRVADVLDGARIRGLPNLLPEARPAGFRALRVRGHRDEPLPYDGRAVLVLCDDGRLRMACREEGLGLAASPSSTTVVAWDAEDEDIVAEDVSPAVSCVQEALRLHAEHLRRSRARYDAAADLADRLAAVLAA